MGIAVLEKAFMVLETLDKAEGPLPLKRLSAETTLPKPTLYRLLQTLLELGYVAQDEGTGFYSATLKLTYLGGSHRHEELRDKALPFMEALHERFNETVNLGVLEGTHVYYVHVLPTTRPLRWITRVGTRDSFYCTALGRAVVAYLPEPLQRTLLSRVEMRRRTPNTVTNKKQLLQLLDETRQRGWALDNEENDVGVMCFGVPLLGDHGPLGSLSVSLPTSRLTPDVQEKLVHHLLQIKEQGLRGTS